MSSFEPSNQLSLDSSGLRDLAAQSVQPRAALYSSPEEEAAAALVHLSGASSITVAQYEVGVPPNLAAASSLVNQLSNTMSGAVIPAAFGSLYTLMDPEQALALTSE